MGRAPDSGIILRAATSQRALGDYRCSMFRARSVVPGTTTPASQRKFLGAFNVLNEREITRSSESVFENDLENYHSRPCRLERSPNRIGVLPTISFAASTTYAGS